MVVRYGHFGAREPRAEARWMPRRFARHSSSSNFFNASLRRAKLVKLGQCVEGGRMVPEEPEQVEVAARGAPARALARAFPTPVRELSTVSVVNHVPLSCARHVVWRPPLLRSIRRAYDLALVRFLGRVPKWVLAHLVIFSGCVVGRHRAVGRVCWNCDSCLRDEAETKARTFGPRRVRTSPGSPDSCAPVARSILGNIILRNQLVAW